MRRRIILDVAFIVLAMMWLVYVATNFINADDVKTIKMDSQARKEALMRAWSLECQ